MGCNHFNEWQTARKVQVPVLDYRGMFKDYDLLKVLALLIRIEDMEASSLINKLVVKQICHGSSEKSGERYPPTTVYGIACGIRCYLEEKNGAEGLNPLDDLRQRVRYLSF